MVKYFLQIAATIFVLVPAIAAAEPIKLKLAFYSSDRSILYLAGIKPFVDAVNTAAKDLVHIDVDFSSKLGSADAIPNVLLDGGADIAFMAPGYTPKVFFDGSVAELPGLFHNAGKPPSYIRGSLLDIPSKATTNSSCSALMHGTGKRP